MGLLPKTDRTGWELAVYRLGNLIACLLVVICVLAVVAAVLACIAGLLWLGNWLAQLV